MYSSAYKCLIDTQSVFKESDCTLCFLMGDSGVIPIRFIRRHSRSENPYPETIEDEWSLVAPLVSPVSIAVSDRFVLSLSSAVVSPVSLPDWLAVLPTGAELSVSNKS